MDVFELKVVDDEILKGNEWLVENPKAHIVIFEGMEEHLSRYNAFARFLNENGYSVHGLDTYGQGLNIKHKDAPGSWPESGFSKSVKTFGDIEHMLLKTGLPVYIFAHSMGSFMAQEYLQRFHERVNKVVLCGTDYASPLKMKFAYQLAKLMVNDKNRNQPHPKLANLVTGSFAKAVKNRKTDFDWLSYNEENVQKYIADPKCGFVATGGFYREFLKGMRRIGKAKFIHKIRETVTIYIIAGKEDPVGHMGKGPRKLYKKYKHLGVSNVHLKLYDHMRHEILNETDHEMVYNDILEFFNS